MKKKKKNSFAVSIHPSYLLFPRSFRRWLSFWRYVRTYASKYHACTYAEIDLFVEIDNWAEPYVSLHVFSAYVCTHARKTHR